ncbi:MAG: two-component sensor histidine kinase [Marinosulfonomonas sp.]|nr:two-component sensor histidine kinase [Marinosulfonomonas sp.]
MNFNWLKRYMPRGLYGRAALILLVPIISLQVVVSLVFIQRHYEDVTRQMTRSLALELQFLLEEVNTSGNLIEATARVARLADPLALDVELAVDAGRLRDSRNFYDLSGRVVIEILRDEITPIIAVDVKSDSKHVRLWMETEFGQTRVFVSRSRVSASNPHQFLVLMVFVGLVMTLVAFIFLRNQLRPIRLLARAAQAFGKGRIEPYRPAGAIEVRSAGNAFLDMRARIERQIEQRTLMLSGVSHDLRTPITRLKLGLSLLDGDADTKDLMRDVEDMERLLDEFLAFARGDALDDLAEVDPIALARQIAEKFNRIDNVLEFSSLKGEGLAMMRPVAVQRALENLIGNALRYGEKACLGVQVLDRSVRYTIEDDGPGIAPELYEEALKPFARLDASRNQNKGSGVGLGLSIAQDIARRHGGTLQLGVSDKMGGLKVDLILAR